MPLERLALKFLPSRIPDVLPVQITRYEDGQVKENVRDMMRNLRDDNCAYTYALWKGYIDIPLSVTLCKEVLGERYRNGTNLELETTWIPFELCSYDLRIPAFHCFSVDASNFTGVHKYKHQQNFFRHIERQLSSRIWFCRRFNHPTIEQTLPKIVEEGISLNIDKREFKGTYTPHTHYPKHIINIDCDMAENPFEAVFTLFHELAHANFERNGQSRKKCLEDESFRSLVEYCANFEAARLTHECPGLLLTHLGNTNLLSPLIRDSINEFVNSKFNKNIGP